MDLLHVDIQGAEDKLFTDPRVAQVLRKHVARIILGTHSELIHSKLVLWRGRLMGWVRVGHWSPFLVRQTSNPKLRMWDIMPLCFMICLTTVVQCPELCTDLLPGPQMTFPNRKTVFWKKLHDWWILGAPRFGTGKHEYRRIAIHFDLQREGTSSSGLTPNWMLGVKHCWMVRFSHVILILHLNKRSHWTGQCFGVGHYKPLQPHRFLTDTSRIIMFSMSMRFEPLQTMRLNYTKTGFLFSLCQLALAMWHVSWV